MYDTLTALMQYLDKIEFYNEFKRHSDGNFVVSVTNHKVAAHNKSYPYTADGLLQALQEVETFVETNRLL